MNRIVSLTRFVTILSICVLLTLFETTAPSFGEIPPVDELKAPIYLTQNIDFEKHFRDLEIEGSILIYDQKNEQTFQYNSQRNQTSFPVASTFKILNSLIAIETGVIKDEISILTWDGIQRELPPPR